MKIYNELQQLNYNQHRYKLQYNLKKLILTRILKYKYSGLYTRQ